MIIWSRYQLDRLRLLAADGTELVSWHPDAAPNKSDKHNEWLRLFANRNEVADVYADLLRANGPMWPGWADINQAILSRWSMAGLRYIKTRAWKLNATDADESTTTK